MGGKMLQDIRQDLTDVVHVCEGKKKQTNDLRTLISDLVKGNRPYWCVFPKRSPRNLGFFLFVVSKLVYIFVIPSMTYQSSTKTSCYLMFVLLK